MPYMLESTNEMKDYSKFFTDDNIGSFGQE